MNLKTWVPLALAIVLGLVAMKIAKDVVANRGISGPPQRSLSDVVVVRHNLPAGAALKADDLAIGQMSNDIPAESIFRNPAELEGRVIKHALFKGQPVLEAMLSPKGTGSGLQALVPKGMRAVTVEINEFSGVAGFLVPGCRVDIVSTIQGDAGETLSRTIVQNVEVTAIGRRNPDKDGQPEQVKSVTLLVKPKEGEAIELAASTGRPRLVLRGSGDDSDATSVGITVAELRGRAQQKKNDPWGIPVELFTPRPMTPSTQPAGVTPVVEMMTPPPHRSIKIIKAGKESEIMLELPRPEKQPKWVTDANE